MEDKKMHEAFMRIWTNQAKAGDFQLVELAIKHYCKTHRDEEFSPFEKGYMAFNYGRPIMQTLTQERPRNLKIFFNDDPALINAYYESVGCGDDRMVIEKVIFKKVKKFKGYI
jgi:hypothetical protein